MNEKWDPKDIGAALYVNGKLFLARRKKLELMKANGSVEDDQEVLLDWLRSEDPDTYDFNSEIERKAKDYYESHTEEVHENERKIYQGKISKKVQNWLREHPDW